MQPLYAMSDYRLVMLNESKVGHVDKNVTDDSNEEGEVKLVVRSGL